MKECVACGREFQDDVQFCPIDGQPLDPKKSAPHDPAAANDPLVGTVLDDKYRLDKKIGEGGMGAVYRATHIHMDSAFAVKLLHKTMVADAQAVERFRREARAAARIRHANAVSVTDFGVTKDGVVYLVMEYLEGGDLRDKLRKVKVMQPDETVRIMVQTCAAIEEAHRKGIVHRDLKPDNIWLLRREETHDEVVKVLDFGIAKLKSASGASNLTQQGMIVGTPHYMSPEQCRGEELDARSDIYSLGIILYEMLSGDVPFRAPTPVGVVLKHANELPKPLRQVNASVPEPIERVVMRTLDKNKDARPRSSAELGRELAEALRLSGGSSIDVPGFNTGDIPATTGSQKRTGGGTAPQTGSSTRVQDPHKTAAVGGNATVAMTSGPSAAPVAKPPADGTQIMSSDAPYSVPAPATRNDPAVVATPRQEIAVPAPAPSRTMLYVAVAAAVVVVIGIVLTVLALRNPGATGTNANANSGTTTNSNAGTKSTVPPGMVLIKGGTFKMGTDDPAGDDAGKPAHEVTVKDFYLDQYEVTNEDYQQFVKQTGHAPPKGWSGKDFPGGEGKFPVANVTWEDAKAYADWAGKRLPTEAEWEYAARGGGQDRAYPWGNDWSEKLSNSKEDGRGGPMPVGSYPGGATKDQVFDMAGNVSEWTADDFAPYPGSTFKKDPNTKVYRGGAYLAPKEKLLTTLRWWDFPNAAFPYIGFRCAKDAPQ